MKKIAKKIIIVLSVIAMCVLVGVLASCFTELACKYSDTFECFGARSRMVVYDDFTEEKTADYEDCWTEVETALIQIDRSVSTVGDTTIAKFNQALSGRVEIDRISYEVLTIAKECYTQTQGAYNPAVGELVSLWGFAAGSTALTELPDAEAIERAKATADFSQVELEAAEGKYYATKPMDAMKLDLGGIGKGYAADTAIAIMKRYGFNKSYIDVGMSSLGLADGKKGDGEKWELPIVNPQDKQSFYAQLYVSNVGVSTSGNYERVVEIDGKSYCHIIDASTGYPTTSSIASATVVSDSAARADALSTALCVMSASDAQQFISGIDEKVILTDGNKIVTNIDANDYKILDKAYSVN